MQKDVTVIDIETANNSTGYGETCPWYGRVVGLGLCANNNNSEKFATFYHEDQVTSIIQELSANQTPLVAYNALFEISWLTYNYPQYPLNFVGDAAILAIALDNSADSFGLKDAASRLVSYESYDQVVMMYLVEHFKCAASKWGKYIPLLPPEMLAEYCMHDCIATLLIWEKGVSELDIEHIHEFFMGEVKLTAEAYILGTNIDREKTTLLLNEYQNKISAIEEAFITHPEIAPHIELVQQKKYEKQQYEKLLKSKTGRVRPTDYDVWLAKNPFNPGSDTQLRALFDSQKLFWNEVNQKFEYPAYTDGYRACVSSDYIHLFGTGGKILALSGEYGAKINKLKKILLDSEYDGRAHFDINLCSVRSTRVSSNGLNIVATPLDNEIGECFIADEGWSYVMFDFFSLEPTIAAMITGDEMLKYTSYLGEGIKPFWSKGILHIDDTYLCYLSTTKRWGETIRQEIDPELWLTDSEKIKKKLKIIRQAGKKLVLMTMYGSGIETICNSILKELGIYIPIEEGIELRNLLWAVFPGWGVYSSRLKLQAEAGRKISTWLGFPISVNQSIIHCIFNYRVQTEAQHVMKHFLWLIQKNRQDWFIPAVPNIHDAHCSMVHTHRVPEFLQLLNDCLAILNKNLEPFINGLKFRISVNTGKTLREAKG